MKKRKRIRKIEIGMAVLQNEVKTKTLIWGSIVALIPIVITLTIGLLYWLITRGVG